MKKAIVWIWLTIFGGSVLSIIITLFSIFGELFSHPYDAEISSTTWWVFGISIFVCIGSLIMTPVVEAIDKS